MEERQGSVSCIKGEADGKGKVEVERWRMAKVVLEVERYSISRWSRK